MDATKLSRRQHERLLADVRRHLSYYSRLRVRMDRMHWSPQCPVYRGVVQAQEAMQDLHIHAHYAGASGAWTPAAQPAAAAAPSPVVAPER